MFIEVTNDSGSKLNLFADHIRSLKSRPNPDEGTVIGFSNGDSVTVKENRHEILNMLDYPPPPPAASLALVQPLARGV